MTSILVFLACLALALAAEQPPQTLVDSIVIESPYEFDFNKWAINRSLEDSLVRLDRLLFSRLQKNRDPHECIKAAKQILKESSESLQYEQVYRKALKTFIALERTQNQCTWKSYLILAENFVATERHLSRAMARVRSTVDHYSKQHAKKCRPYYKEKFKAHIASIDSEDLRKIQLSFAKLTDMSDLSIIATSDFEITEKVINSIVDRIAFMMREAYEWQQVIAANGTPSNDGKKRPISVASFAEKYLLKPCENYRNHFKDVLVPARLDAAVEDEDQWNFLTTDESFSAGLKNYIICNSLIRNAASRNHYLTMMQYAFDKLIGVR